MGRDLDGRLRLRPRLRRLLGLVKQAQLLIGHLLAGRPIPLGQQYIHILLQARNLALLFVHQGLEHLGLVGQIVQPCDHDREYTGNRARGGSNFLIPRSKPLIAL